MDRPKYNLTKTGFNSLVEKLQKAAKAAADETVDGLQTSTITTNFVKMMTKVKGMEDVIERNEQLSKTYQGFLNLYGFDTMYDMYLYARSCDLYPEEILKSDVPRIPVTKTIIRNGKPQDVTILEALWKAGDKPKKAETKKEEEIVVRHAREFKTSLTGDDEAKDPAKVAKIKARAMDFPEGDKPFSDKSTHYLSLNHNNGRLAGVIGYTEDDTHLRMDFYRHNGQITGTAARGFAEMIQLAMRKQKGVKAEDNPGARMFYFQCGLKQQDSGHWEIGYDELKNGYGEFGSDSE